MMDFAGGRRTRRVHRRGAVEGAGGEDEQARLSRRLRDGDDVQHAAGERPDLVVRGEQLSAGQRSVPVRPAVLERRLDAHAGADAQLLSAQDVSGEPAGGAGRDQPGRRADRSAARSRRRRISCRRARIISRRGSRPIAARSCWADRSGSCWRRRGISPAWSTRRTAASTATGSTTDLPADPEEWFKGATEIAGSWWPDWHRWVTRARQGAGAGARAGRRQAEGDRGRAGQLREGAAELVCWRIVPPSFGTHAQVSQQTHARRLSSGLARRHRQVQHLRPPQQRQRQRPPRALLGQRAVQIVHARRSARRRTPPPRRRAARRPPPPDRLSAISSTSTPLACGR